MTAPWRTRLLAFVTGLLVLGLVVGASYAVADLSLWLALPPFAVAVALVCGWWKLSERLDRRASHDLFLGTFRRRPALTMPNLIFWMQPLPLFVVGTQLATMRWTSRWWVPGAFALFFAGLWIASLVQPSDLRLTTEGMICRRNRGRRIVPWNTLYPGDQSVHRDKDGGVWVLADETVSDLRTDRMAGRPDGPPGYHWVRASTPGRTATDPVFLARTISHFHANPDERALIGTPDGLRALRTTWDDDSRGGIPR